MNEIQAAGKSLQTLIDTAVQKGLFENAKTVIAFQQCLNTLVTAAEKTAADPGK